eukprot:m51a1_g13033 putative adenylate cyclase (358) ;mRNA; f:31-2497
MEQCWDQAPSLRPAFTDVIGLLEEASDMMADTLKSESESSSVVLPRGRIALVFTDIQQSTELWETNSAVMKTSLYLHHSIMRAAFRKWNGVEVKTEGDAFMIAFQHVSDAVCYASEAQKLLVQAQWDPTLLEHPACAEVRDVVLSTAAREELETCLGKVFQFGVLRDLGPVTFKGLNKTENIHEFVVANLERNFDNPESQECYNRLAKESKPFTVAIKKFFRQKVDSVTLYEIEHQIKEIAVLAEVRHPSILLFEVINEKALSMGQAVNVLVSVCNGMVYLHMSNIVHRDLKSTNILVCLFHYLGWMAPEVLKDGKYSESSDVFSSRYVTLMEACWDHDPVSRPGFHMISEQLNAMA